MKYPAYPEYRPSQVEWVQTVPVAWEECSAKMNFLMQLGKMLQNEPSSLTDVEITYLKALHVNWDRVMTEDLPKMWASPLELENYEVKNGDLLVCEGGEVGRAAIIKGLDESAIIQNALHRLRGTSRGDVRYFAYLLRNIADAGWFAILCNKATIAHLTGEKLGAIYMPVPTLAEQQQIAAFLDWKTGQIDALTAKKKELLEKLKEKRLAVITQAVTKGLNPAAPLRESGIPWLGQVPEHWEVIRFGYRTHIQEGQVDPEVEPYSEMLMIAPNHIESDTGRLYEVTTARDQGAISGKYLVLCGDVVYSKIRPHLNKCALADFDGLCSADMYPIRTEQGLSPKFLCYWMLAQPFHDYATESSMRVAMPKLNRDTLNAAPLVVPPPAEQRMITMHIDVITSKIDRMLEKTETAIARLAEYRTALITAATTGKIDVRNVTIGTAA